MAAWLAAGCGLAARAATPPPLPSLRHLVFNFDVATNEVTEKKIEGGAANAATSEVTAGKTTTTRAGTTRKGQISIDVVAATPDFGLVVDVKQISNEKGEPLTRVAITQDGVLSYDPSAELSAEETAVLRLLARGVIGSVAHAKGDTWDVPLSGTGYSEKSTYTVLDVPSPSSEIIEESGAFQQTGIHAADGTTHGKITFDPTVVVPVSATLTSRVRAVGLGTSTTTDTTIELTLAEDSFAKKKAS